MEPICAPATPLMPSAVAVVRVSGDNLGELLAPLVRLQNPREVSLCRLKWDGFCEQSLVLFFPAPRSYTGEDVVEFQLHGNPLLVRRLMDYLFSIGVRLANPGEFTQRALLNGKQSLLDAEALQDLIGAVTDTQIRQAQARAGGIPAWLHTAKTETERWAALAEASVDYGDDENISLDQNELRAWAQEKQVAFHVEQTRAASARWLRDGIRIAIVGSPNAGKSTLFNAIAGEERAIVTKIPGTTRDILEVRCEWAGLPLWLLDTAGLRNTEDIIERQGIERVIPALEQADLIICLIPVTERNASEALQKYLNPYKEKTMTVRSKCDLLAIRNRQLFITKRAMGSEPALETGINSTNYEGVNISAINGDLKALEQALADRFLGQYSPETCLGALATARQRELLIDLTYQMRLISGLPDYCQAEIPASLLQGTLSLISRLTGEDRTEVTLNAMFSNFCLGK